MKSCLKILRYLKHASRQGTQTALSARLPRLVLLLRTQGLVGTATDAMECVERACQQIMVSDQLYTVLRVVLTVGNTLNFGTHRGNADGMRLESLKKLADMKVSANEVRQPRNLQMRGGTSSSHCRMLSIKISNDALTSLDFLRCVGNGSFYHREFSVHASGQ